MDISKMTKTELEALAYQTIKKIQVEQNNLAILENRIAELQAQEAKPNGADKNQN
jgi:hypothetical protein